MKAQILLQKAQQTLENEAFEPIRWHTVFSAGGAWMFYWLQRLQFSPQRAMPSASQLNYYGFLKYSICLFAGLITGIWLFYLNFWLLPFSVIVFYSFEIQALFLFPLLMDGAQNPIKKSMAMTRSMGYFQVLTTVMMIGFFMIWGFANFKNPLKNWYTGCLAIVIWYLEATQRTFMQHKEDKINALKQYTK